MKKMNAPLMIITCLLLLWLLPLAASAEEDTAAPGTAPALKGPYSETEAVSMDLNGDGVAEEISLSEEESPYGDMLASLVVRGTNGEATYSTEILSSATFYIADLDPEDGQLEVLVSGDIMSDDYCTWVLRYDGGQITSIPYEGGEGSGYLASVTPGQVTRMEGANFYIYDKVDVLGSWWGERPFRLSEDKQSIEVVPESAWTFADDYDDPGIWQFALELNKALPYFADDGAEGQLPATTKLRLTETDSASYIRFRTQDGVTGRVEIAPSSKGWGFEIDGIDEEEWFVMLPYSG